MMGELHDLLSSLLSCMKDINPPWLQERAREPALRPGKHLSQPLRLRNCAPGYIQYRHNKKVRHVYGKRKLRIMTQRTQLGCSEENKK